MTKKILITIIVLAVIGMFASWMIKGYNGMVIEQENVENAWGQVQSQYQRRFDLIPNIVASVKQAAITEHDNLVGALEARAKATQMTIDASNLTEEQLAKFQAAQGELSQALGRLMAVAESYPQLQTNQNYRDLITQLEGTENRIAVARNYFNETAQSYNTYIRKFPNNILASIFGFTKKPYFQAEEEAQKAVKVDFGS